MDLYTSNFQEHGNHRNAVSIAGGAPAWYIFHGYTEYIVVQNGKKAQPLAPSWNIYNEYQKTKDSALYTRRFYRERLLILGPQKVYQDLLKLTNGEPPILLCYEKKDAFCHRQLVRKWLEEKLGLRVAELSKER